MFKAAHGGSNVVQGSTRGIKRCSRSESREYSAKARPRPVVLEQEEDAGTGESRVLRSAVNVLPKRTCQELGPARVGAGALALVRETARESMRRTRNLGKEGDRLSIDTEFGRGVAGDIVDLGEMHAPSATGETGGLLLGKRRNHTQ